MISRKDTLLDKAKNRTITQAENNELLSTLEQEARNAKAVNDFIGFLITMGVILFLVALAKDLFGD